jgi:hypothetical protein
VVGETSFVVCCTVALMICVVVLLVELLLVMPSTWLVEALLLELTGSVLDCCVVELLLELGCVLLLVVPDT